MEEFKIGTTYCFMYTAKSIMVGVCMGILPEHCLLQTPVGKKKKLKQVLYVWDQEAREFWERNNYKIYETLKKA